MTRNSGKRSPSIMIEIQSFPFSVSIAQRPARVATRDGCTKTRRPQTATPATRRTMCTGTDWARNARTATAYETGNSGTSITIHGPGSSLTAVIQGSIVMLAIPRAWIRRSHHRPPVSVVTRKMTSMGEVTARNVIDVMKLRSGRRLNQAPASFVVGSLKPAV